MAQYRDVELTDGRVVRVYQPPMQALEARLKARYPPPEAPTVTDETVTGKEITMVIEDDPAYLKKLEEWEVFVSEELDKAGSLFLLQDEKVPSEWDIEAQIGERIRYFDPEWEPREGSVGRKLDYIEWNIYDDIVNRSRIINALNDMTSIDSQEVAANVASFPDPVEGEAD